MGTTNPDRNKVIYNKWRKQGFTHKEALNMIPAEARDQFQKETTKPLHPRLGLPLKWKLVLALVIPAIILGIIILHVFSK